MMKLDDVDDIFNKASKYLDIHSNTLYALWSEYLRKKRVPISYKIQKRMVRMKFVGMEWCDAIRVFVESVRIKEQRCVEIPDIQKFLRDKHDISIGRSRLRYRMKKWVSYSQKPQN